MFVCMFVGGGGWQTWRLPSDIHSTHVVLRLVNSRGGVVITTTRVHRNRFRERKKETSDTHTHDRNRFLLCVESDTCVGDTLPEDPESSNLSCQKEWIDCR